MKSRLLALYFGLAVFLAPVLAMAQKENEETALLEGRLEGYGSKVRLDGGSPALTYLLLLFLAMIALAALFKNAKRTHLD